MTSIDDIRSLMKSAGIARGQVDSLAVDQTLEDQGLDSFDRMSLVTELEEEFDIEIAEDVARTLTTLNAIVDHVNKQ